MTEYAITAIGEDRPGIVAAVTEVLFKLGCNLSDCSMSLLRRQFAMILLVEAPSTETASSIEQALAPVVSEMGLGLSIRSVAHAEASPPARPFVISIYGADHPGIVYSVAKVLAGCSANIVDLSSHTAGDHIYVVVLEVDLPKDVDPARLEADLKAVAEAGEFNLSMRSAEPAEL